MGLGLRKFDNKQYEGEWKDGFMHGAGKYIWGVEGHEDKFYDGEYYEDQKHGFGKFQWFV